MRTRFELELRVCALADHATDDLLETTMLAFARAQHLDVPFVVLGITLVHTKDDPSCTLIAYNDESRPTVGQKRYAG